MDALEQEVIEIVREYRTRIKFFAPSLLVLFGKIADRLDWQNLKKEL